MDKIDQIEARKNLKPDPMATAVTVLGGIQGAAVSNEWAMRNFQRLSDDNMTVCCVRGLKSNQPETIIGKSTSGHSITNIFCHFVMTCAHC
jgi:UDP-N-acetylglucosamine:LPS N-acetylglucosamine transferase